MVLASFVPNFKLLPHLTQFLDASAVRTANEFLFPINVVRLVTRKIASCNVSVNSNWVHPPGQPPGISSKTLPGVGI